MMRQRMDVLGIPVSLSNMENATSDIVNWAAAGEPNFVIIRDVHGIMLAQDDQRLLRIHRDAAMVTPDGMPLVWLARWEGHSEVGRVCGTDLVGAICEASQERKLRHFFYGGKAGVAQRMATALLKSYPDLLVVGCETPPFRPLTQSEDTDLVRRIEATGAQIVWVGLSTPKQEYWMAEHLGRIPGATLIGIGAAFDFIAGDVRRAPKWMQSHGLEWAHRLASEPKRLWRRYLILAPKFLFRLAIGRYRNLIRNRSE